MKKIKLSILVPTVPSRIRKFYPDLLEDLDRQIGNRTDVEVLGLYDNKRRSVGEKRNALLEIAQGEYLVFIDDDDRISNDYIALVTAELYNHPDADCIVYDSLCSVDNEKPRLCKYGIEYERSENRDRWFGKPAHTMVWRSEIAKSEIFPSQNFSEDSQWVDKVWGKIKKQYRISKVLYFYDFNNVTTETRNHRWITKKIPKTRRNKGGEEKILVVSEEKPIKCSVVMATFNKEVALRNTLESIVFQNPDFGYEVIVVDDGSTDGTMEVCKEYMYRQCPVFKYLRLTNPEYRNPSLARNIGYKAAVGDIIVAQSDDVVHSDEFTLQKLCELERGTFNIARVYDVEYNQRHSTRTKRLFTGSEDGRPLFFLGSLFRDDVYKIGGNCEDFNRPGYEDDWFGRCLTLGLKLKAAYKDDIIGFHQSHGRPENLQDEYLEMKKVLDAKICAAEKDESLYVGGKEWKYEK